VNKVVGNIQISPGRSFQAAQSRIYELVPYLKNDGNRHDFSHNLHYLYFTADDEADESKAQVSREMRERLGIYQHPLDDYLARVRVRSLPSLVAKAEAHSYRPQKHNTCSITSSRSYRPNSVLWTVKSSTRTSIASRTLSATSRPALRAARTKVYR
jgi:Endoplasmic reticulum vesicle transporter